MANTASTRRWRRSPKAELDLVVAATGNAVMMVESEAKELSEETMLGAVQFAHAESARSSTRSSIWPRRPPRSLGKSTCGQHRRMKAEIKKLVGKDITAAYKLTDKSARSNALNEVRAKVKAPTPKPMARPR
jgi:polyribonucleotide nucleotidyltransferase